MLFQNNNEMPRLINSGFRSQEITPPVHRKSNFFHTPFSPPFPPFTPPPPPALLKHFCSFYQFFIFFFGYPIILHMFSFFCPLSANTGSPQKLFLLRHFSIFFFQFGALFLYLFIFILPFISFSLSPSVFKVFFADPDTDFLYALIIIVSQSQTPHAPGTPPRCLRPERSAPLCRRPRRTGNGCTQVPPKPDRLTAPSISVPFFSLIPIRRITQTTSVFYHVAKL